jgi:hypothetical protein
MTADAAWRGRYDERANGEDRLIEQAAADRIGHGSSWC